VHGGQVLSWADLEDQSDTLAACLLERGVEPGACVALLLERSPRFVVAALAVLKTGSAYLPLDCTTPPERLEYILADSGAQLVLAEGNSAGPAASAHCPVLDVPALLTAKHEARDFELESTLPYASHLKPHASSLDDLAYIIYTSGSTGQPKGVEITWGNLLNLIQWHQKAFGVTAADRMSQVARLAFDAAVWEIWPALAAGACLHIVDEQTSRSPTALQDYLLAQKITIAFAPTLLAEQLLLMDWPADTALRFLLTGADTLHRRPSTKLPFALVNNYGPTECTVVATSGIVAASEDDGPPSIGRPIDNAEVSILDENQRTVPPGEAGELCLSGALVGRGYRNNPQLTAARFIHCPLTAGGKPIRMYRTGDRAKLLPSGEIAFLGRLDEQVKIRGYRVELGEIVACLDRFPGVDASATAVQTTGDGPNLVAYVVLSADARQRRLTANDLREFLAPRLPDYMIPATFVSLASLPVTPNGKLDRSALPPPSRENMLPDRDSAAETTWAGSAAGVEGQLAELVASLVGRPVSLGEDFFLVGGHSLLGVQLLSRIKEQFGVKLGLRQLFSTPTVAGLSAEIIRQTSKPR
jgi:amino acid adenylation domain-containing protein